MVSVTKRSYQCNFWPEFKMNRVSVKIMSKKLNPLYILNMLYPAHQIYSRSSYFKQRSPHQVTKFNITQIAIKRDILMVHLDK